MGLGEGIVRKFVEEEARVMIFDINSELGTKVAQSLPEGTASFFSGDVTNEGHWHAALKEVQEIFGSLDVVVNNAGVVHNAAPSHEVPQEEYERIMRINVSQLYHSAKVMAPYFKEREQGVFVNVSSISAPRPRPNLVW